MSAPAPRGIASGCSTTAAGQQHDEATDQAERESTKFIYIRQITLHHQRSNGIR